MKLSRVLSVITCVVLAGVFYAIGYSSGPDGSVETFNDGFSTSKQDDCQQGFHAACEWLGKTK